MIVKEGNLHIQGLRKLSRCHKSCTAIMSYEREEFLECRCKLQYLKDSSFKAIDICFWCDLHHIIKERALRNLHREEIGAKGDGCASCSKTRAKRSFRLRFYRLEGCDYLVKTIVG